MAKSEISDLLMKFEQLDERHVEGEASTIVALEKSEMTKGFDRGYMFEVDSFQFRTGIASEDDETAAGRKKDTERQQQLVTAYNYARAQYEDAKNQGRDVGEPPRPPTILPVSSVGAFQKWREGNPPEKGYPVDMAPIEFSRGIDKASAVLMQNCIDRTAYKSASLIKRKAAGGKSSGLVFMRFDFTGVLMTRIDWDDENPIKEKCRFICRAVTIHYKPQLPDGSLGGAVRAFWRVRPGLNPVVLR